MPSVFECVRAPVSSKPTLPIKAPGAVSTRIPKLFVAWSFRATAVPSRSVSRSALAVASTSVNAVSGPDGAASLAGMVTVAVPIRVPP